MSEFLKMIMGNNAKKAPKSPDETPEENTAKTDKVASKEEKNNEDAVNKSAPAQPNAPAPKAAPAAAVKEEPVSKPAPRPVTPAPEPPRAPAPVIDNSPKMSASDTVLCPDVKFKGAISFKADAYIDGAIDGEITSAGSVTIGKQGKITADIKAVSCIVEGVVTGNVTVQDRVELRSNSKLVGDIKAKKLVIRENVIFKGNCQVGGVSAI